MDHRRRTTRRTALFADTLEDDSSVSPTTTPFLASSCYRRPPPLFLAPLSAPSAAFMESHDSDSRHSLLERPGKGRIFRLRAKSINDGSARFYRWDRAGSCSTPEHPFLGPMGYIRPSAIDIIRLFRDNLPRIVRYRCFLLFFFFFTIESISSVPPVKTVGPFRH